MTPGWEQRASRRQQRRSDRTSRSSRTWLRPDVGRQMGATSGTNSSAMLWGGGDLPSQTPPPPPQNPHQDGDSGDQADNSDVRLIPLAPLAPGGARRCLAPPRSHFPLTVLPLTIVFSGNTTHYTIHTKHYTLHNTLHNTQYTRNTTFGSYLSLLSNLAAHGAASRRHGSDHFFFFFFITLKPTLLLSSLEVPRAPLAPGGSRGTPTANTTHYTLNTKHLTLVHFLAPHFCKCLAPRGVKFEMALLDFRCQANFEHIRHSRPDYGLELSHFQCKSL